MADEKSMSKEDVAALKDYVRQVTGTVLGNLDAMQDQTNTRLDQIAHELKSINRHLRSLDKKWPNSRPE